MGFWLNSSRIENQSLCSKLHRNTNYAVIISIVVAPCFFYVHFLKSPITLQSRTILDSLVNACFRFLNVLYWREGSHAISTQKKQCKMHGMPCFHNEIREDSRLLRRMCGKLHVSWTARQVNSVSDIQVPSESTNKSARTAECLE